LQEGAGCWGKVYSRMQDFDIGMRAQCTIILLEFFDVLEQRYCNSFEKVKVKPR